MNLTNYIKLTDLTNLTNNYSNMTNTNSNESREINTAIKWLQENGYPVLPVAPAQDPHQYPKRNKETG